MDQLYLDHGNLAASKASKQTNRSCAVPQEYGGKRESIAEYRMTGTIQP
jgi:hypothetical protein